jgi:hypothetical protein
MDCIGGLLRCLRCLSRSHWGQQLHETDVVVDEAEGGLNSKCVERHSAVPHFPNRVAGMENASPTNA